MAFHQANTLIPPNYPSGGLPPWGNHSKVPGSLDGFALQRQEAVVMLLCMPPPLRYFGITSYVTQRLLSNQTNRGFGDAEVLPHRPLVEVSPALNYINLNTSAGTGMTKERKSDPHQVFGSTALLVFTSSREVRHG